MAEKNEIPRADRIDERTAEVAIRELQEAHAKWRSLPEGERAVFNAVWLSRNGFRGLWKWINKNTEDKKLFVLKAGAEIAADFEVNFERYTPETILKAFRQAHAQWQSVPEEERGAFSTTWLHKNGFSGVHAWIKKSGGDIKDFAAKAGEQVSADFEIVHKKHTPESVLEALRQAHARWHALPETNRGVFNAVWLRRNGFNDILRWSSKNAQLLKDLATKAGEEVAANFEVSYERYTPEIILETLRQAHSRWRSLPEEERGAFNATWLTKNGFHEINRWSLKNSQGIKNLVSQIGGEVADDFEVTHIGTYSEEMILESLHKAYATWRALPEDERPAFNAAWLGKNGFSEVDRWARKNGKSLKALATKAGTELAADLSRAERYDKVTALEALRKAHSRWRALPEEQRGAFNAKWIARRYPGGLYAWIQRNNLDLEALVSEAGTEVAADFEARPQKYTKEIILTSLRKAHVHWRSLPEADRGVFNQAWLQKNGYQEVSKWATRNGVNLRDLVNQVGDEISSDLKVRSTFKHDQKKALETFQRAHAAWRALPEEERGTFNAAWLEKNGFRSLIYWAKRYGGNLKDFISGLDSDVAADFEFSVLKYSSERILEALREAHARWRNLPEEEKGTFNVGWLVNHGFSGLVAAPGVRENIVTLVAQAGAEVSADFKANKKHTLETILTSLQEAHTRWRALPEEERGVFNTTWLEKNGFAEVYRWARKNKTTVKALAAQINKEVESDFDIRIIEHTLDTVLESLRQAHAEWRALPEDERGEFNVRWLTKHGFTGPYEWSLKNNKSLETLLAQAGDQIAADFTKTRVSKYDRSMATEALRRAHAQWGSLPEEGRDAFNVAWLVKNGFGGLVGWVRVNGGIQKIVEEAGIMKDDFTYRDVDTAEAIAERRTQETSLNRLVIEVSKGETPEAKKLCSLITALGGSRALDILYKFRPEYRSLQPEYVKGVLVDYLGDFLAQKRPFKIEDVEASVELLSDLTFREGLFETLKDHCLRYYFEQKKTGEKKTSSEILYGYLVHIKEVLDHIESKELEEVIRDVVRYYDSVLKDFDKPRQFVDALDREREFPDINQKINMKELADKRRLLIADEMGLGKSASVIMAKEHLRVGCALVVTPSNVLSTWQRYLSDDSEQGGYFRKGEAPRVLVVESPEQLEQKNRAEYDYILISQERLNDRYVTDLKASGYDMLVVDEVHKLKSLEGERTKGLLELSEAVEGEGKYLALLSGTPAPNKVEDIAVALKLLYPEKFQEYEPQQLVSQIIRGDFVDLRALLLPRMQMKTLEESVDMPELQETMVETKLSNLEQDVYDILLEEDELTAAQKMTMLRQFLMNPDLLDATPGIQSTKIEQVAQDLRETFATHRKAVMFVNGYVEGMIRGEETIVQKLNLPDDVVVRVIHGENRSEREAIQQEFRESREKILLVVSGQTADVGVDFTAGEKVLMYNEPWTEYERRQQIARTYRPGLAHDLEARTYVTEDTIEEGIHDYTQQKYRAVEKLLRGIPLQDLEKQLLTADEKRGEGGLEVNQELAEYYFSSWDKLMKMFAYVKEIGEKDFQKFLAEHGRDYAESYVDLGNRSYQANANRVTGTLIDAMIRERGEKPDELMILDLASGPEMLKQHIPDEERDRVISADANLFHFKGQKDTEGRKAVAASWLNLPFREKSFNYLNLSLALPYSNFVPSQGKFERMQVLSEANRVLKPGGRIVLNLIYSMEFRDPAKFNVFAEKLGFRVIDEYSGEAKEGDRYRSGVMTLEKVSDIEGTPETIIDSIDAKDYSGLKFRKTEGGLRNQRKIVDQFELGGRKFDVRFNEQDKAVRDEERTLLELGEGLKKQYGSIASIPRPEIIENGFVRIRVGEKYLLFKKLEKGTGAVIVK